MVANQRFLSLRARMNVRQALVGVRIPLLSGPASTTTPAVVITRYIPVAIVAIAPALPALTSAIPDRPVAKTARLSMNVGIATQLAVTINSAQVVIAGMMPVKPARTNVQVAIRDARVARKVGIAITTVQPIATTSIPPVAALRLAVIGRSIALLIAPRW